MSTHPSSSSSAPARNKGMRKGTRSCFECRKRKIRCIFRPEDPSICVPCKGRGSECTEQRRELIETAAENSKANLRERVAKLEAIIEASGLSARNLPVPPPVTSRSVHPQDSSPATERATPISLNSGTDKPTPISSSQHSGPIHEEPVDADALHDVDPIVNLFNNSIWRRNSPDEIVGSSSSRPNIPGITANNADPKVLIKRLRTREVLLRVLPTAELLGAILNVTCSWWDTWMPLGPWLSENNTANRPKILQDFVLWAFSSDNPAIVGLAILCVAVSIQQLDAAKHGPILNRLPRLPGEIFQEYFELVDRLIVNDSEYASTREGIEVMILSAKMLMNLGLIRKSWVLNHRMISYAQLLGLHRPQRLSTQESDAERRIRHRTWLMICQSDVLLSLLLGLPCVTDGRTIPQNMLGESGTLSFFHHKMLGIAARVIDKNQMGLSLSVHTAQDIQKEAESLAMRMPHHFWDAQGSLANGKITEAEYRDWTSAQNFFHLARVFLHMPLMIQSIDDSHLAPYREACLEAARDALKTYQIMRSHPRAAFSMVKLIDYEAFICSTLIILGLIGYGHSQLPIQTETSKRDRDLVQCVLNTLRQASATVNNAIASQAVQGLESLTLLASADGCPPRTDDFQTPYARIVVPYSGTITISPGPYMMRRHSLPQPAIANSGPVFKLSQGIPEPVPEYGQSRTLAMQSTRSDGFDTRNNQEFGSGITFDYPSIDFDWSSMIQINEDEDWAWLMDVDNNGMAGMM